jgi:hypothetical protein
MRMKVSPRVREVLPKLSCTGVLSGTYWLAADMSINSITR